MYNLQLRSLEACDRHVVAAKTLSSRKRGEVRLRGNVLDAQPVSAEAIHA
jgi:hypothetical protein